MLPKGPASFEVPDEFIALWSTGWAAKQRAEQIALPIRILTGGGAQVALQRCPILRAGKQ